MKDNGNTVAIQKAGDTYIFTAAGVPSKGYKTYVLEDGEENEEEISMDVSVKHMENDGLQLIITKKASSQRFTINQRRDRYLKKEKPAM